MKKLLLIITLFSTITVFAQNKHIRVNSQVGGTIITYSLYQKQTDNSYTLLKSHEEDRGWWAFDSLSAGIYRVHESMVYAKYIPTWFPRKPIWDEAADIDLTTADSFLCNEGMLPNPSFSGPGSINGELSEGLLKTEGEPLKNVRVVIKDAANNFIKMTSTNDSGKFTVSNLPVGTYKILVDMINVPTANPKTVILDSANLVASVDLTVNGSGTVTTGIKSTMESVDLLVLYPNPTSDFVAVNSAQNVTISIYNLTGMLVAKGIVNQFQNISVQHLSNGIYTVTLLKDGATHTLKMSKQ